jgi:hypothetical protein
MDRRGISEIPDFSKFEDYFTSDIKLFSSYPVNHL